ncbi:MAG: hydroxyethylthiazole kinase [Clostridia bacterium]|nr:hydroxyethylthiazole kinase [Clostridia bacterium]
MFESFITTVKERQPLVFAVGTGFYSGDLADSINAAGGCCLLCEGVETAREADFNAAAFTMCNCLEREQQIILEAGMIAEKNGVPVVFDLEGIAESTYRQDTAKQLLGAVKPACIIGSAAEISCVCGASIDTNDISAVKSKAKQLAKQYNAVVAAVGRESIVTDGERTYIIRNGSFYTGKLQSARGMLTGLTALFCGAVEAYFVVVAAAVSVFGVAAEYAEEKMSGLGSFKMHILDGLSTMNEVYYKEKSKIEEF